MCWRTVVFPSHRTERHYSVLQSITLPLISSVFPSIRSVDVFEFSSSFSLVVSSKSKVLEGTSQAHELANVCLGDVCSCWALFQGCLSHWIGTALCTKVSVLTRAARLSGLLAVGGSELVRIATPAALRCSNHLAEEKWGLVSLSSLSIPPGFPVPFSTLTYMVHNSLISAV